MWGLLVIGASVILITSLSLPFPSKKEPIVSTLSLGLGGREEGELEQGNEGMVDT